MCFKKPSIITFGGKTSDIEWMYNASDTKKCAIIAEAPNEVVRYAQ